MTELNTHSEGLIQKLYTCSDLTHKSRVIFRRYRRATHVDQNLFPDLENNAFIFYFFALYQSSKVQHCIRLVINNIIVPAKQKSLFHMEDTGGDTSKSETSLTDEVKLPL